MATGAQMPSLRPLSRLSASRVPAARLIGDDWRLERGVGRANSAGECAGEEVQRWKQRQRGQEPKHDCER